MYSHVATLTFSPSCHGTEEATFKKKENSWFDWWGLTPPTPTDNVCLLRTSAQVNCTEHKYSSVCVVNLLRMSVRVCVRVSLPGTTECGGWSALWWDAASPGSESGTEKEPGPQPGCELTSCSPGRTPEPWRGHQYDMTLTSPSGWP